MASDGVGSVARQLGWYFGGLVVVYVAGVALYWPASGNEPDENWALVVMMAPTAGALLARFLGGGRIQWGRLSLWIVAGLLPAVFALVAYMLGAAFGWDTEDPDVLLAALAGAPLSIAIAAVSATGEEIGWRGFLWPLMRERASFLRTSVIVGSIWWLYHVPFILLGWYGTISGLPAFTVGIAGFTLFVGVLTDRSRSIWPSVMAHGAWNALVATSFAASEGVEDVPAFSGSDALLGEFGWLAALSSLLLGVLATWWHLSRPMPDDVDGPPEVAAVPHA